MFSFFRKNSQRISISEMIEMEKQVNRKVSTLLDMDNIDDEVFKKLKLRLEYVSDLPDDYEAELAPTDEAEYNGVIKLRADLKKYKFAFMHEVIHYIFDVGVGERVKIPYTRKRKGKEKSKEEQMVDYKAAASIMPYHEILEEVNRYDNSHPRLDEIQFVKSLETRYEQSTTAVIRRIQEVRTIKKTGTVI